MTGCQVLPCQPPDSCRKRCTHGYFGDTDASQTFCAIGVYSTNNNSFDIWMVALFGLIGYAFIKLGCESAPLLLGFILGPMMEEYLRRTLLISRGDWAVFVERPISASLLVAALLLLTIVLLPMVKRKREEAFVEE